MRLWSTPRSRWLLGIPIGGFVMFVLGALALGGTNVILHETSSTEFCLSCHVHQVNTVAEYEASSHANNEYGIRAGCSDCHLPDMHASWFNYVWAKTKAGTVDVYKALTGVGNTPERYEADRAHMARSVWIEYRNNGSAYCLHCHNFDHMVLDDQERRARRKHQQAQEEGGSCIDCHQGLVHALPEDWSEIWKEVEAETAESSN